jgi:L-rhamnose mutarotase
MASNTRRICLALDLVANPDLIAEYERYHEDGSIWPEVVNSIERAGIEKLEIYRVENRLVMIMDVNDAFSAERKAAEDHSNPVVQKWERLMSTFQQPLTAAQPGEKWARMNRICRIEICKTQ